MAKQEYGYRLLRYVPCTESGEFYNIGVVVYDADGRVAAARFTPDFDRMRCNPAVDFILLNQLRSRFDEALLLGEGSSGFVEQLIAENHNGIEKTALSTNVAVGDLRAFVEGLVRRKLATPPPLEDGREGRTRGAGRGTVRRIATEAFARHGLFLNGHGVQRSVRVKYGEPADELVFDFQYREASGQEHLIQAMGLRNAKTEARSLCLVRQEYKGSADMTVVADDALGDDVRNLLGARGIGAVNLSTINTFAGTIREKLGLSSD